MKIIEGLRLLHTTATVAVLLFLAGCSNSSEPPAVEPDDGITYVTPEEAGWSSARLDTVRRLAAAAGYAAVMASKDGQVFFSWGDVSRDFLVHSIRKPFLSALYGIEIARGKIDLAATVGQLGIDDIPPALTAEEKQATVRELLQSRSGVYHEAAAEDSSMAGSRPPRGSHPHGTFFYYNNWDFNVAGVVFRLKTGRDIFEAFREEIAVPIGMQDFRVTRCNYYYELQKSQHPAYVFRMSARDMVRFGVLYLGGGRWLGRQVVPASWVQESTAPVSLSDSILGISYGHMWVAVPEGSLAAQIFGSTGFGHAGAGVHVLLVFPPLHLVVVLRVNTDGPWVDPGEDVQTEIIRRIIQARR